MADVFISFAPEDRVWAGTLARELSSAGFDVLWDLSPGLGEAQRDVEDELAAAKAIITVWSSASRNSNWVRDVAQEAFERGVLLPVLGIMLLFATLHLARFIGRLHGKLAKAMLVRI